MWMLITPSNNVASRIVLGNGVVTEFIVDWQGDTLAIVNDSDMPDLVCAGYVPKYWSGPGWSIAASDVIP